MATLKIKISLFEKLWRIVNIYLKKFIDYIAIDDFIEKGSGLFAILDGHGGG